MSTRLVGVALAVGATAPLMGMFLPPLYEVRAGKVGRTGFRETALIGSGGALVVGVLSAAATGSPWPFFGTLFAVAIIYGVYEWALRNPVGE